MLKSIVKGVDSVVIDDAMLSKADALALALDQRLDLHIHDRVDELRVDHWTLHFTRDNLPPMSAAMCLVGHIVDDIRLYKITECLLHLPMNELFQIISGDLSQLEGCYLHFDPIKYKWTQERQGSWSRSRCILQWTWQDTCCELEVEGSGDERAPVVQRISVERGCRMYW